MIDYDKLKKAHELADKYQRLSKHPISIEINFTETIVEYILHIDMNHPDAFSSMEDLIAKLQQLTQPKSRYKVGDNIWAIAENMSIHNFKIKNITPANKLDGDTVWYGNGSLMWHETNVYPTKAALIESRIEYWTKLKINEISASKSCPKCGMQRVSEGMCWNTGCDYKECQHESDGFLYCSFPPKNKCLKCGEFYR